MDKIRKFLSTDDIIIVEEVVKDKLFLDELISYINKLVLNCQVEYDRELDETENEIKNIFIEEMKTIIKNLTMIMLKYFTKKPNSMISLELTNKWYCSEKFILATTDNNVGLSNPYAQNKTISSILTIICKQIDFLNDYYLNKISGMERYIEYLKIKLKEEEEKVSVNQFYFMTKHFDILVEKINKSKEKTIDDFRRVYTISKPILQYFITIFSVEYTISTYLQFTPISLLNIFRSSLYFIKEDYEFLDFIVKFKNWLPSEYRCKYGVEIIKLLNDKDLDYKNKKILRGFNPNPCLLIEDIITLYYKTNKDKSILEEILSLEYILSYFKEQINWTELDKNKIIKFVSVQLSLTSKFEKNEIGNEKIYLNIMIMLLDSIISVMSYNNNLFESYLAYLIPNKLISFYDTDYSNIAIRENLDKIFRLYLSSKLGIYYLASMIELEQMEKIVTELEQKKKFIKWFNYYKYINENVSDSDIMDPLTSSILVVPYVIPMDNDFIMSNICDKNIIESYLWEKNENPFTRGKLTIEKLREFNELEKNLELVKNTKIKLKQFINDAQKINI
jgi:hypothetical protein